MWFSLTRIRGEVCIRGSSSAETSVCVTAWKRFCFTQKYTDCTTTCGLTKGGSVLLSTKLLHKTQRYTHADAPCIVNGSEALCVWLRLSEEAATRQTASASNAGVSALLSGAALLLQRRYCSVKQRQGPLTPVSAAACKVAGRELHLW